MRDPTLPIQSFRLKCGTSPGCNLHDINQFIWAAVQRGIQNLILDLLGTDRPFSIRLSSTISRNLVVLKLKNIVVEVLPQVYFPLLKALHLKKVIFKRDLNKLMEGCPILEELHLTSVVCMSLKISNGEFKYLPSLVTANIYKCIKWNISFAWICNAKFLRVQLVCLSLLYLKLQ
jgi:hypothetical protein